MHSPRRRKTSAASPTPIWTERAAAARTISKSSSRSARSCARWRRRENGSDPLLPMAYIGRPQNRVDGPAKVTGKAKYAAEYAVDGLVHGWIVGSAIARGAITRIDASEALALPGVLQVFTHENRPDVPAYERHEEDSGSLRPLRDGEIHFSTQPIA